MARYASCWGKCLLVHGWMEAGFIRPGQVLFVKYTFTDNMKCFLPHNKSYCG